MQFQGRRAGGALTLIVASYHALLLVALPVLPSNDAVGYVALGHTSAALRPYDPYAPISPVPPTSSLPAVEAWKEQQHPAYGYPWVYLDLPPGWQSDPAWVLRPGRAPLVDGPTTAVARETDVMSLPGLPLWFDAIHALFPPHARLSGFVALNHGWVVLVSVLLWRIGIALGRPGIGWLAGLLYGLWFIPASRAQEVVSEPLFIALDVAACWMAVRAWQLARAATNAGSRAAAGDDLSQAARRWDHSAAWLAAAGVTLGLAFAVRTVAAPQCLLLGVVALAASGTSRQRWTRATAAAVGFGVICGAILVHNGISYDRWTFSTGSGRHIYQRVSSVEKRLAQDNASARLLLDLAARPRCEGEAPHPLQGPALDPWIEPTSWALYFMLRSHGLSITQADSVLGDAAWATIRERPAAYAVRGLRNLYRLLRRTDRPPFELFDSRERWREALITWMTPYTHVAPYVWVGAQWRAFHSEFPIPEPPEVLAGPARSGLLAALRAVPRLDGPRTLLALAGLALALALPWARAAGWPLVSGWMVAVVLLPAFVQVPIARYGEPAFPLAILLALFAIQAGWARIRRERGAWVRRQPGASADSPGDPPGDPRARPLQP